MLKSQSDVFNLSISSPVFFFFYMQLTFEHVWYLTDISLARIVSSFEHQTRDSPVVLHLHLYLAYQILVGGGE
jgi:hypothetical protein